MPWNLTASIRGSRQGSSISLSHAFGSLGEFSSRGRPLSAIGAGSRRPGSRLTSASPLAGRGLGLDPAAGHDALSSLSIPGNEGDDLDILGDFDLNMYLEGELDADRRAAAAAAAATAGAGETQDSFQIFGPAAAVDTQTAAQSQWLAATLDQESRNFLEFVQNRIEALPAAATGPGTPVTKRRGEAEADDIDGQHQDTSPESTKEVSFSALLPPESNTRVVATQGLMHVLTLATKGILAVRQERDTDENGNENAFGEIFLSVKDA